MRRGQICECAWGRKRMQQGLRFWWPKKLKNGCGMQVANAILYCASALFYCAWASRVPRACRLRPALSHGPSTVMPGSLLLGRSG
eukprot:15117057-Alexandrium_andersonii.AAC.1